MLARPAEGNFLVTNLNVLQANVSGRTHDLAEGLGELRPFLGSHRPLLGIKMSVWHLNPPFRWTGHSLNSILFFILLHAERQTEYQKM